MRLECSWGASLFPDWFYDVNGFNNDVSLVANAVPGMEFLDDFAEARIGEGAPLLELPKRGTSARRFRHASSSAGSTSTPSTSNSHLRRQPAVTLPPLINESVEEKIEAVRNGGMEGTASRACWYRSRPSIAISSVETTSPAPWPSRAAQDQLSAENCRWRLATHRH